MRVALRTIALASVLLGLVAIHVSKETRARRRVGPASAVDVRSRQGKTRLRLLTFWTEPYKTAFDQALAEFAAAHPSIEPVQEAVPATGTGNLTDMLKMQIAAGAPPDLFIMAAGELAGPFIDHGHVLALDDAYAAHGWRDRLVPWAVDAVRRDGKLWGVPFSTRAVAFFYRADIFRRLGLRPPRSYDELERLCEALKGHGIACLSLGGKFGWNTMRLLDYFIELGAGPELHDQLNRTEARWDRPEVVRAYGLLRRWIDRQWIMPGFLLLSPSDARMPFYRGQAALVLEGDWIEAVMKDDEQPKERIDFFIPPTGHQPERFSAFPQQLMIPAGSRNQAAAIAFLDWYTRPEVQRRYYPRLSLSTATVGVQPDPGHWPIQHRWRPIMDRAQTYLPTDQVFKTELMDAWFAVQDALVSGQVGPEEAGRRMQATIESWKRKQASPPEVSP